MTCVNTQTMYSHAKEPTKFDGVQNRGAYDFPWSSSKIWIGPHVVGMEALLHQVQAVGVVVMTSSVEI
jgi:hypothetical protein